LRLVPDESGQQALVQRLRAVIAAKDEQIAVLAAQAGAVLERERRPQVAGPRSWNAACRWTAAIPGPRPRRRASGREVPRWPDG
jgi:hypothetical protein